MRPTFLSLVAVSMTALLFAVPVQAAEEDNIIISADDGTYKTIDVTSAEECNTLCEAETGVCRGSTLLTETTILNGNHSVTMLCRLNDGLSPKSPFEIKPPTPLDIHVAVADLNEYRAEYGLSPVTLNAKLNEASKVHAEDLAAHGMAAHIGSDGSTHAERVKRQNYVYQTVAENVATGQKSWDIVFQAWKDSPGHNKNLLADGVEDFGIALVYEPTTTYTTYWTMLVGSVTPEYPPAYRILPTQNKAMVDDR